MSSIFPNWLTEAMLLHRKGYASEQINGDITSKRKKKPICKDSIKYLIFS